MRLESVLIVTFILIGIGFGNLTDSTDNHLRRKFELVADVVITAALQLDFVKSFIFKGNAAYEVASGVKAVQ